MGLFDRLMQPQAAPRRNLMDTQMVRRPSEERVLLDKFYPPDYSKLKRGQFRQDTPQMREYAANVPVDVGRGTFAGLFGLASDTLNFVPAYSPMPMEQFGDYNYAPSQKVPYGSEYFLESLPLAPAADNPLGRVAGQLGSFAPMVPVQAARIAGKGAAATGRFIAPKAGQLAEGYMQRMGMMPGIVPAEGGLLTPSVKPQAPVSDLGFYSAAEQAALNLQRNKGTGQSFINDLMKAPDVKKEELAWTGLDEFLANKPNVTKQEVQDFLAGNRVDLQERQLSGRGDKFGVFSEFNPDKNQFMVYGEDLSHTHAFDTAEEADNFVKQFNSQIPYGPSKYDKYQLPGGENYREILLTLPFKEPAMPKGYQVTPMQYDDGTIKYFAETPTSRSQGFRTQEEAQEQLLKTANNLKGFRENLESYQSSHFNEPNVLAHMRVNDRIDADGKKMLLIEELQSDWHQAGREKGYKGQFKDLPNDYKVQSKTDKDGYAYYEVLDPQGNVFAKDYSKGSVTNQAINRLNETVGGVPDAPFKDTWHQLALKRALKYAADNGYERVGLTTGKQQAERYDLSKQISKVYYSPPDSKQANKFGTVFKAFDSRGHEIINKSVTPEELPGIVGKEIAQKLLNAESNSMGVKALEGIDLSVGGEGMKKYYDEIYPAFLAKQGKKFNAKTGETRIKTGQGIPGGAPVHYIDISPEMKGGVSKGQPMFAAAPIAGVGLGAGQQQQPADILTNELDYPSNPMYTDPLGYSIR